MSWFALCTVSFTFIYGPRVCHKKYDPYKQCLPKETRGIMYNKTIRPKKRYSPLQFIDTSQPTTTLDRKAFLSNPFTIPICNRMVTDRPTQHRETPQSPKCANSFSVERFIKGRFYWFLWPTFPLSASSSSITYIIRCYFFFFFFFCSGRKYLFLITQMNTDRSTTLG